MRQPMTDDQRTGPAPRGALIRLGLCALPLVAAALIVDCRPAVAADTETAVPSPTEYQVKAAFLYNFAKFVEWPRHSWSDAAEPLVIGVLGQDPFGDGLERIFKANAIAGRRVTVKRSAIIEDLRGCNILFISASEKKRVPQILKSLDRPGVLTVGDARDFTRQGGVIGFTMEDDRVHFEINVDAAARTGLKLSSKLLNVATIVHDGRSAVGP